MNQQNPFVAYIVELINRFATKSPRFFRILQMITGFVTAVTGIPALFAQFNIPLPEFLTVLQNKYAGFLALGMFIVSLLSTQSKIVATTETGVAIKKTNEKALPFTAQAEEKKAAKEGAPVATVIPKPNV